MSRRISISEHEAWQHSLLTLSDHDEIDEVDGLVADPLTERHAKPQKESQAARLIDILDELERSAE